MEMDTKKFGTLLIKKRKESNMTQRGIGKKLSLSQMTISNFESDISYLTDKGYKFTLEVLRVYGFSKEESEQLTKEMYTQKNKDLLDFLAA